MEGRLVYPETFVPPGLQARAREPAWGLHFGPSSGLVYLFSFAVQKKLKSTYAR